LRFEQATFERLLLRKRFRWIENLHANRPAHRDTPAPANAINPRYQARLAEARMRAPAPAP
jgi:hypothetical protein